MSEGIPKIFQKKIFQRIYQKYLGNFLYIMIKPIMKEMIFKAMAHILVYFPISIFLLNQSPN